MRRDREKLKLGVILDAGSHAMAWRHPDVPSGATWSFQHIRRVAQSAERGLLDMVFFADSLAIRRLTRGMGQAEPAKHLDPIVLLSALAAVTEHVGLVTTATTTYNTPYYLARLFASLDHVSNGRAGWNLVTSMNGDEAQNFGLDAHPEHDSRYERAREFAFAVRGLWDSWEDDAFLIDKQSGQFFDPAKLHVLNHAGTHFSVRGPLNVPRSPQGYPVITQAGSSVVGRELGAETADVIFTAQHKLDVARGFYADVKGRLARYGRSEADLKIMPGFVPIVGSSRQEADDRYGFLESLLTPEVGLGILSNLLGVSDLSGLDLDGPIPDLPATNNYRSRQALLVDLARRDNLTVRDLYRMASSANGHRTVRGTAADIADEMEQWFEAKAADGFVLIPAYLPGALDDFVDAVIPELQRRDLFRTAYEGRTLRENLGLKRPPHPRAVPSQQKAPAEAPAGSG